MFEPFSLFPEANIFSVAKLFSWSGCASSSAADLCAAVWREAGHQKHFSTTGTSRTNRQADSYVRGARGEQMLEFTRRKGRRGCSDHSSLFNKLTEFISVHYSGPEGQSTAAFQKTKHPSIIYNTYHVRITGKNKTTFQKTFHKTKHLRFKKRFNKTKHFIKQNIS